MWEAKINRLIFNTQYHLISCPTTKLENLALSVNRHYLPNIFLSTIILLIPCFGSLFTNSFSTNKRTVLLFCIWTLTRSYVYNRDLYKIIINETHNLRTINLLVLKDYVNIHMYPPYSKAISSTQDWGRAILRRQGTTYLVVIRTFSGWYCCVHYTEDAECCVIPKGWWTGNEVVYRKQAI
jgi:hypothetical protein